MDAEKDRAKSTMIVSFFYVFTLNILAPEVHQAKFITEISEFIDYLLNPEQNLYPVINKYFVKDANAKQICKTLQSIQFKKCWNKKINMEMLSNNTVLLFANLFVQVV